MSHHQAFDGSSNQRRPADEQILSRSRRRQATKHSRDGPASVIQLTSRSSPSPDADEPPSIRRTVQPAPSSRRVDLAALSSARLPLRLQLHSMAEARCRRANASPFGSEPRHRLLSPSLSGDPIHRNWSTPASPSVRSKLPPTKLPRQASFLPYTKLKPIYGCRFIVHASLGLFQLRPASWLVGPSDSPRKYMIRAGLFLSNTPENLEALVVRHANRIFPKLLFVLD